MGKVREWFKRVPVIGDQRGNIIIIMIFALPALLAAAGLAVDVTRYFKTASYIQSAVDQAAIAAAAVDGQDREQVAARFFKSSLTEDLRKQITLNTIDIKEDFPSGGPLTVNVVAHVAIANKFGAFVGLDSVKITRSSVATRAVENVEAVITMASSGTMCSTKSRVDNPLDIVEGDTLLQLRPDPSCTHFNTMKAGVNEFIQLIRGNETVADFRVGLVPFNHKVRMPDLNNIPPSVAANEPAGWYQSMDGAEPLSPLVPLTADMNVVERALNNLRQTENGRAWARTDLATHAAGLMLDPDSVSYFPGGAAPASFTDTTTQKVVILMTDGSNIGCCFTNHPSGDFTKQYVYSYKPYNDAQLEVCDALKAQGVKIFSILFDVSETDPGGREINNVFARCASGAYAERDIGSDPNASLKCAQKQNCYNVPDDKALVDAYRQIAQTFYKPRLTQ